MHQMNIKQRAIVDAALVQYWQTRDCDGILEQIWTQNDLTESEFKNIALHLEEAIEDSAA